MRWTPEEEATFIARFPRLHQWPDGRRRLYTGSVGRGWISLLERIFVLAEPDENAIIGQIKEKYGSLRVYLEHDGVSAKLLRVIDEVERESETICEACGAPAKTSISESHWIYTFCDTHMPEGARYLDDVYPSPPTPS